MGGCGYECSMLILNTFLSLFCIILKKLSDSRAPTVNIHIHSAELEAVSISLVMGSKVVVVENTDAENGRINARTQEEDCDETRHLVEKALTYNLDTVGELDHSVGYI